MQIASNSRRLSANILKKVAGQSSSAEADESRLEALTVLSTSLLQEIQSLSYEKNKYLHVKIDLVKEVQDYEASLIRCALVRSGGNQRIASRLLNIKISTLNNKIKRLGILPSGLSSEENVRP